MSMEIAGYIVLLYRLSYSKFSITVSVIYFTSTIVSRLGILAGLILRICNMAPEATEYIHYTCVMATMLTMIMFTKVFHVSVETLGIHLSKWADALSKVGRPGASSAGAPYPAIASSPMVHGMTDTDIKDLKGGGRGFERSRSRKMFTLSSSVSAPQHSRPPFSQRPMFSKRGSPPKHDRHLDTKIMQQQLQLQHQLRNLKRQQHHDLQLLHKSGTFEAIHPLRPTGPIFRGASEEGKGSRGGGSGGEGRGGEGGGEGDTSEPVEGEGTGGACAGLSRSTTCLDTNLPKNDLNLTPSNSLYQLKLTNTENVSTVAARGPGVPTPSPLPIGRLSSTLTPGGVVGHGSSVDSSSVGTKRSSISEKWQFR
mmetsp:Transcript_25440/g.49761  ORF Transcript_25440/g.49761 Transcript_25440/m.49761 type:complete len:367 (+) Transcript_25440:16-1116(+)